MKHAKANVEKHEKYLAGNVHYGEDVFRVQDIESLNCWYGYIYTENNSSKMLQEKLRPQLQGISVIYPLQDDEPVSDAPLELNLDIPAGAHHILILRRVQERA